MVNDLTIFLAPPKRPITLKLFALLADLGGTATTEELIAHGEKHGANAIRKWNVTTRLGQTKPRVAKAQGAWHLLPLGYEQVRHEGFLRSYAPLSGPPDATETQKIAFIGHGHSPLWRELEDFLEQKLHLKVVEFNSVSAVGLSTKEKLQDFLDTANVALLLMTGEDETADGRVQARQNVVHEVGLFQGRLGFERAAILLEEGCSDFSNATGIGQIRFPKGNLSSSFEGIRDWLTREALI